MPARLTRCLLVLLLVSLAAPAWAQSTGGSFGGGSFGGSSGGSSSSSSSSSSWSGSSSSSSSGSSGGWSSGSSSGGSSFSGGDCEGSGAFLFFLIAVLVVVVLVRAAAKHVDPGLPERESPTDDELRPLAVDPLEMHCSQLQLGIDWHARKELQATLSRLAASGDTATAEGRARLLSETVMALRRAEMSWLYAGFKDLGWHAPSSAEGTFHRAASDARARFERELVRNQGGQLQTGSAPDDLAARPEEGAGTVVVTLVVVARRAVRAVADLHQAASLREALEDRGALTASQLVALEVVWSPAAEQDRMSTSELEQNYPELVLIDPASIAGRVFCEYCSGAFPMELLTCPHCGAAVTGKAEKAEKVEPPRPKT